MAKSKVKELLTIFSHYGGESQLRMLQEECAEVIQSVNKLFRNGGDVSRITDENRFEFMDLMLEIADVMVVTEQIVIAYGTREDVLRAMEHKINRQLDRIYKERSRDKEEDKSKTG